MVKRAVVVGINDYTTQWPDGSSNLNYCVRDAQSMYHMLIDAFDFDPSQTFFYTDQQASRANILRALRYITACAEAGDVAAFYYSGHGARVPATAAHGDADKWYEAIIPASGDWISDWEIQQIGDALQPSFVNFTVILDSCHSGGMHMTDALQKARSPVFNDALVQAMVAAMSTIIPFGVVAGTVAQLVHNVTNVRRGGTNGMVDLDEDPDKTLIQSAKSTLIAGCQFNELSWEHSSIRHGFLTQSFLDIVNTSPFSITYGDLLDELRTRVKHYVTTLLPSSVHQTPQLRGQMNRMTENFLAGWRDSR